LPYCAARCHAMCLYLSLARNNFFFNAFGLSSVSSAQTDSFLTFLYGCFLLPFGRQYVHPQFGLTTINLFHYALLSHPHIPKAPKLPPTAARCHAMNTYFSLDRKIFSSGILEFLAFLQPRSIAFLGFICLFCLATTVLARNISSVESSFSLDQIHNALIPLNCVQLLLGATRCIRNCF
jgi:hypothetical protein